MMDLLDVIDMDFGELKRHLAKRYRAVLHRAPPDFTTIDGHHQQWKDSMLLVWTVATILMVPVYIYVDLTEFHLNLFDSVLYLGFIFAYSGFSYLLVYLFGIVLFGLLRAGRDGLKELFR